MWFDFVHVTYIKDKQMLVYRFMFDLLGQVGGLLSRFFSFWGGLLSYIRLRSMAVEK